MSSQIDLLAEETTGEEMKPILTPQESADFVLWISGAIKEPPEALQKVANNLVNKLNYGMAYIIAQNMQRSNHMVDFMREAEIMLFDKGSVLTKETDELLALYDKATKTLNSSLEFTRKYISQNKDALGPANEKIDSLKELLLTLPKDKLDTLIDTIQKGNL